MHSSEVKILEVVNARNDRSDVPGLNTRLLAGRPLLAYSIMAARACRVIERVCVSTNDADVLAVAQSWGARTMIPPESVADDPSLLLAELRHALRTMRHAGFGATHIALFPAACPLRRVAELDRAIDEYLTSEADTAMSVSEMPRRRIQGGLTGWNVPHGLIGPAKHDTDVHDQENGAFYISRAGLIEQGVLIGPKTLKLQLAPEAGAV